MTQVNGQDGLPIDDWRTWRAEETWQSRPAHLKAVMIWQLFRDTQKGVEAYGNGRVFSGLKHSLRGRAAAFFQIGTKGIDSAFRTVGHSFVAITGRTANLKDRVSMGREESLGRRRRRSGLIKASRAELQSRAYELAIVTASVLFLEGLNHQQSPFLRWQQELHERSRRAFVRFVEGQ